MNTTRVKLKFRIVETHTIERDVDAAEFAAERDHGNPSDWLKEKFLDDPMPDSDVNTELVELDSWETVSRLRKSK